MQNKKDSAICVLNLLYLRIWAAEVVGGKSKWVGEIAGLGFLPAKMVNVCRGRIPILFIEKTHSRVIEFVLVVNQAFANKGYRLSAAGEAVEKFLSGH